MASNTSQNAPATDNKPKNPQSLKNKTFTTLHDFNSKVLTDDFVHSVFETYKIKGSTAKGSTFEYKAKAKIDRKEDSYSASLTDESNLKFPFFKNKYWLWLGQRRNGDLKAHVDFGELKVKDYEINVFSNLKTTTKFDKFALRLGANYFGKRCESNNRIEHTNENDFVFTTRNHIKHGKFLYGFVAALQLKQLTPTKYDAFVGYESKDLDVYLKHLSSSNSTTSESKSSFSLGTVNLSAVYRHKDDTFGAEIQEDFSKKEISGAVVGQHKINDKLTAKAKFDNQFKLALAAKYNFSPLLTVAISGLFDLKNPAKAIDLSKGLLAFPFGFETTLNV